MEAEVGLDEPGEVVGCRSLLHQPHLLAELSEVGFRQSVEGVDKAVALEREPDRDQDLLNFLVGDPEHDGAPIGKRHHEPLVLELAERLADGPAAGAELGRERRLDESLAGLVAPRDDRAAKDLDDLLPARAALAGPSIEDDRRGASSAICHHVPRCYKIVDNQQMVDNPARRA